MKIAHEYHINEHGRLYRVRYIKQIVPAPGWRVVEAWTNDGTELFQTERPVIGWGIVKRGYENLNNSRGEWGMDKTDAVELLIVDSENKEVCSVDDASRAENLILVILEPNETITDEELLAFVNEKRSAAIEKRVEAEIAEERLAEQEGALSPHDANLSPAQLAEKQAWDRAAQRGRV